MSSCNECKDFLDENIITDRPSYLKWSVKNHPDKFRQFGEDDNRFKEATRKSAMANDCFPRWYSDAPTCKDPSAPTPTL